MTAKGESNNMATQGWIGVDLDGTLAKYDSWRGETHIGEPIPLMVGRVQQWIINGQKVKIVTARVSAGEGDRSSSTVADIRGAIERWCLQNIGAKLEVTCCKDFGMIELWDDRAIQVIPNTGQTLQDAYDQLERTKAVDNG